MPVIAAGWRIEPPVSVPIDSGASKAASAAAEPPPEPPGMRAVSHGLRVGPYAEYSVDEPMANSSMFVLPRIVIPAARSRAVTVASYGGRQPSRIFDPQVVGMSIVVKTSLSASGTPASGDAGGVPASSAASTRAADCSADSAATCRKACTVPSTAAIRSRWACATSTAETSREWIFSASWRGGEAGEVHHASSPRICGTRKRPSSAAGAQASACSCVRPGRRSSARNTFSSGTACEVGGISSGRDLTDAGDGAEDDVELAGEQVELTVGDGEPGEPGEVRDLVPADRARGVGGHVPPRSCGTHSLGAGTHAPRRPPHVAAHLTPRHPSRQRAAIRCIATGREQARVHRRGPTAMR